MERMKARYRRDLKQALAVFFLCLPGAVLGDSSVWEITAPEPASGEAATLYLGGTVHLLRQADYPLPAEYELAYKQADELVFETDISSMNDPMVQMRMLEKLSYQDERTLESVLDAEAYQALRQYTMSIGIPVQMLAKFKPGMVVTTLQVMEFQRLGYTPQGVDAFFDQKARNDGLPVAKLEEIDEQIDFLAQMGEGNESEFIMLSLQDMENVSESMEQMLGAWRQGDNELLEELFVADMQAGYPELYESLLVERNENWMPLIEAMFEDQDTEFVLVGAAHLVGEDGLLAQLEARGYTVERFQLAP